MSYRFTFFINFVFVFCLSLCSNEACHNSYILDTFYGSATIHEPVLVELINSQAMQRLKRINQYGVMKFINPAIEYTRYQHSLGVLYLMRHFGACLQDQIVGLLHDVSHTAFSHVVDYLFNTVQNKLSYQDEIYEWYINSTDILPILQKYHLSDLAKRARCDQCHMLKDDLPNLCADRLEYNLYGGYLEGMLNRQEVLGILDSLKYENSQWVFYDVACARQFATVTVDLSEHIWCSAWNGFLYTKTAELLKYAFQEKIITLEDLTFSYDEKIWSVLVGYEDPTVQEYIRVIKNYRESFTIGDAGHKDIHVCGKFRGVNPLIKNNDRTMLLSDSDPEFKAFYYQSRQKLLEGWYIKYC